MCRNSSSYKFNGSKKGKQEVVSSPKCRARPSCQQTT
ncbi:hypothetical protein BVRB_5g104070 [Beta vulgaris subsp. vulgaris]|nr:hypothetical protein BVRB_5g104070 [Beta vulgaris subsp. vulgaris]